MRNKPCGGRKARLICEQDIGANDPDRAPPKRDIPSGSRGKSKGNKRRKNRLKERQSDARQSQKGDQKGFFFRKWKSAHRKWTYYILFYKTLKQYCVCEFSAFHVEVISF